MRLGSTDRFESELSPPKEKASLLPGRLFF